MNKLFLNPTYEAKIGYNGFNMSQRVKFTSTTGELLPVYFDLLQPGDKVTISSEMRTRTLPIESPAMMELTESCDWFFVPIEQIYKLFGSWFFRIDDHSSSLFNLKNFVDNLPSISMANLKSLATEMKSNWKYFADAAGADFRLCEMLGCPMDDVAKNDNAVMAIVPLLFCAYQKIYFDFYRLSDRETVDPEAYSLDKWYSTGDISLAAARKMFTLRYAPWKRDFFTSSYVSPVFGQKGISGIGELDSTTLQPVNKLYNQWLTAGSNALHTAYVAGQQDGLGQTEPTQIVNAGTLNKQLWSPTAIRTSFALQKLLEVTRRAGKHYDAQQLAHFGVELPNGIAGEVKYIGSQHADLHIGDIISTAETSEGVLGQLAGKGYAYGSGSDMKFSAPSHGILMCIYSAVPDVDYSATGLDRLHTYIDTASWPRPEFDNLGMQPLFAYQAKMDNNPNDGSTNSSKLLDWQYRYAELKTKFPKVFGGLKKGHNLSYWVPQREFTSNQLFSFLASPFYLNQVMTVGYSPTVDDPFNSDPLIHDFNHQVRKASKMSTYGLESL